MSCTGTCTVRIFDIRNLKAEKWPDPLDEAGALRYLQSVVNKFTSELKESGCPACGCTPLADYLPDPATGARKKEGDWTAWRLRNVIDKVGDGDHEEFIFGT